MSDNNTITVVGGGLAGLTAAIACAEGGASVTLYEAHRTLGGRARSSAEPYVADDGPHALYAGASLRWLAERGLAHPIVTPGVRELRRVRFRHADRVIGRPPLSLFRMIARRGMTAPVDEAFGQWATRHFGAEAARAVGGLLGVVTFEADPGRLSAAFVWERFRRVTALPPQARYVIGGWGRLIGRMAERARALGVRIETGSRVDRLPDGPVIVATSLDAARVLLGDETLRWESGRAVLLDLGVRRERADLFLVSDLDEGGFLERCSLSDPTLAPPGESLVQSHMPMRAGESKAQALDRLERLADLGMPGWRERVTWRRDGVANRRTGALDLPGTTWRDRPAIDRGDGVWLAGDSVAAPGLLGEVAINSAVSAARAALSARPRVRAA